MEINKAERSLKIKIAYYGPATCGKTTNLNVLYQQALGPRKGDFISVNSQQDRTILCDLLPLRAGGFCGYDVRLRLLAVPGQSVYLVSRRAVLKGSAMPEEAGRVSGGPADTRSAESLAESYAEASAELSLALNDMRLERDRIQGRLAEIQTALELAEADSAPLDLEQRALRVLGILAGAADASNASFFLTLGEVPEVLHLPPLVSDPLTRLPAGAAFLAGQVGLRMAQLHLAGEDLDLREALACAEPPFQAVALVPLRSAERLLGLALLYFWPHASLPTQDLLTHLSLLARVLAGPLEATAAREAATDAARLRILSRASASAMISVLTRLSLGALRRQPLAVEDLLTPLRAPGVEVEVEQGTPSIQGDAALLRFALTTLIHRCEAAALDRGELLVIRVRAAALDYAVQIHVMSGALGANQEPARSRHAFDDDTEMTAVNAILAQHGSYFVVPEGEASVTHFTLQFDAL